MRFNKGDRVITLVEKAGYPARFYGVVVLEPLALDTPNKDVLYHVRLTSRNMETAPRLNYRENELRLITPADDDEADWPHELWTNPETMLTHCVHCMLGEGALTTSCPGTSFIFEGAADRVHAGELDFHHNKWILGASPYSPAYYRSTDIARRNQLFDPKRVQQAFAAGQSAEKTIRINDYSRVLRSRELAGFVSGTDLELLRQQLEILGTVIDALGAHEEGHPVYPLNGLWNWGHTFLDVVEKGSKPAEPRDWQDDMFDELEQ